MPRIDSHQHFWKFNPLRDAWINDDMRSIQRDFLPEDLKRMLDSYSFDGCISVQADQSTTENKFLLDLASRNEFVRGVVGWVDLQSPGLHEQLSLYSSNKLMKGFRHVLQGEPQRDFMLRPDFMRGISALNSFGFTYDILIFPDQLGYTKKFIEAFPNQPFVVDHLAKPYIREKKLAEWKSDISDIAEYENVFCKVSGMVTEADWKNWEASDFRPYLDTVLEAFGPSRLMFGSDWPVCQVAATYSSVVEVAVKYFGQLSRHEQDSVFGNTAKKFYNL
ncbi:MAG: amidohydrolase family protein [Chryseolinea sp.]